MLSSTELCLKKSNMARPYFKTDQFMEFTKMKQLIRALIKRDNQLRMLAYIFEQGEYGYTRDTRSYTNG